MERLSNFKGKESYREGKGSKKGKLKREEMEGRNNLTVVAYVNQINLNK